RSAETRRRSSGVAARAATSDAPLGLPEREEVAVEALIASELGMEARREQPSLARSDNRTVVESREDVDPATNVRYQRCADDDRVDRIELLRPADVDGFDADALERRQVLREVALETEDAGACGQRAGVTG